MRLAVFFLSMTCFFTGIALLVSPKFILPQQVKQYAVLEPYFSSPIKVQGNLLFLRQDAYGKGYFGASRNGGRTHQGIDLLGVIGQPIFASKSGRISRAEDEKGYGQFLQISHPDGLFTRYAHLSKMAVKQGDWVEQGQLIGFCGKTGNADHPKIKPHLHFEIRDLRGALNPSENLLDPKLSLRLKK